MTLERRIEELAEETREGNRLLREVLAILRDDREALDTIQREQRAMRALQPGTVLYGYCGGHFGGSYGDKTVKDVRWNGRDLVVTALEDDRYEVTAEFVSWEHAAEVLAEYTTMPKDHPDYEPPADERPLGLPAGVMRRREPQPPHSWSDF